MDAKWTPAGFSGGTRRISAVFATFSQICIPAPDGGGVNFEPTTTSVTFIASDL
jgi:hypothetical protein